jgi:hypothetical protein
LRNFVFLCLGGKNSHTDSKTQRKHKIKDLRIRYFLINIARMSFQSYIDSETYEQFQQKIVE